MFIIINTTTNHVWQMGEWRLQRNNATKYRSREEAEKVILFKLSHIAQYCVVENY